MPSSADESCRFGAIAISAAYVATNLVLSLRFLTSQSQSVTLLNAAKPWLVLVLAAALALLVLVVLRRPGWAVRPLGSPVLAIVLIGAFAAANLYFYPLLDREALKLAGDGSDADDALIDAASRLLRGEAPYAAPTYRGNPISPGIGWVALNALWASHALFFLMTPLYLALLAATVRIVCGAWPAANLVVIGHLACLGFWELAPTHDLAALGVALAGVFLAAHAVALSPAGLMALCVLTGVVATARLPFGVFPLLAAALLWRSDRWRAVWLGAIGTGVAVALPLAVSLASAAPYQPLHLLAASRQLLAGGWLYAAGAATAGIVIWCVGNPGHSLAERGLRAWACLAVPFGALAVAQLASIGFETGRWEGANYLMPAFSFAALAFALIYPPSPASSQSRPARVRP